MKNPSQMIPEFFFPGRPNGLDFAYLLYVNLFECFGDIFFVYALLFKGNLVPFSKKNPLFFFLSFFFPFFSSFFLLFFAARAIFRVRGLAS